jgi:L-rhamnonate dehydratase
MTSSCLLSYYTHHDDVQGRNSKCYSHLSHSDNIAAVKKWREAVGPDFPLMIDCYMSLTLPYAIELARRCEPYNVKWIEETLPPDDYEGYSELKKAVKTTLITTGEHEYTRKYYQKCP